MPHGAVVVNMLWDNQQFSDMNKSLFMTELMPGTVIMYYLHFYYLLVSVSTNIE